MLRHHLTTDNVDEFSAVFDVARFKKNRIDAYVWLLKTMDMDSLNDDALHAHVIYDYMVRHDKQIPSEAYRKYRLMKISRRPKRLVKRMMKLFR